MSDINQVQDLRVGRTTGRVRPILTIAVPTCNDFDSCSQTMVNLVNQLGPSLPEVEFVIVDNSPTTGDGYDVRKMATHKLPNCHYVSLGPRQATFAGKQVCIEAAQTEWVMVIDSHILLIEGALRQLLRFIKEIGPSNDLFHGPICTERWEIFGTHMNPALGDGNFGRWGSYRTPEGLVIDNCECYKLPMHGMGLFLCRRDTWPGFNTAMFQFGSEEGYIHEKYRLLGRDCWGIPFLKWWHRFRVKSKRFQYHLTNEHKYRNYQIAWTEVGLPLGVIEHVFKDISDDTKVAIRKNVADLRITPMPRPEGYVPFMGYPMRVLNSNQPHLENYREFEKPVFA